MQHRISIAWDGYGKPMGTDHTTGSTVHTYDVSAAEPLSQAVVNAVSAVSNAASTPTGPSEAEVLEPLYTVVDPDALEAFFRPIGSECDQSSSRITFSYHGCEVTVHAGIRITVTRPDA